MRSVHIPNSERVSAIVCLFLAACSSAPEADGSAVPELGQAKQAVNFASATDICSQDPRVVLGHVSQDVCVGAELFFRDEFGGNGRSCASCHPADNNYTIDADFISDLPDSDPLFVAENDPALAGLERPDLLRDFGLILENVDGAEDPTVKFTMRSVPHCFSLSRSITAPAGTTAPPLERTGWSSDGAPNQGRLKDFQTGAIFQHYTKSLARDEGTDFIQATESELDAIDAFLKTIGRMNEIDLNTVSLVDSGAESGRTTFLNSRCNGCHRNAGANNAAGVNNNFDTGVERLRIAELDAQNIPFDGGFGGQGLASFNFDANGDGTNDSFGNGQFNTTPLIEAADTGPFFHTNAFASIEDAIGFYNTPEFNNSPAGSGGVPINLSATQIANVGRFLRVLNAAFNTQLALARANVLASLIDEGGNTTRPLQSELARLALVEVRDALTVLSEKNIQNTTVRRALLDAQELLETAGESNSPNARLNAAQDAIDALESADGGLGSGMSFTMGQGTHMF